MLTPRLLVSAKQAAVYFELDDYYVSDHQIAPSSWWGTGARRLGLGGEVDRQTFAELLTGRLPNGEVLRKGGAGTHRPGIDFTFSAPKSVSLAALVGGDDRILAAHERAVGAALQYIEDTAPRVRIRKDGTIRFEASDNLLVARFNHDSSRAADPQLHTHAVVLNVTQRQDGAWRAISNEELFRSVKAGGAIYRAELARELRRFGYQIDRTHADGRFEIGGISKEQIAAFSKRRAQIVEHLESRGLEGPVAAGVAARKTRERKQHLRRSVLRAEWNRTARAAGLQFDGIRGPREQMSHGADRTAAEDALDHAIAHLTERKVVASEKRIIEVGLGYGMGQVRLRDLSRALQKRLERDELVHAVTTTQKDPFARHYTTDAALATEQDLVHLMERGRDRVAPIADPTTLNRALERIHADSPYPITRGQEAAIRLALSTKDQLIGIQGYAGTGKTTGALLHIRQAAQAAGFDVRGFAPSAAAAEILSRDAGIPSMTLAKLLRSSAKQHQPSKKPQLWIVDEVSMMGNDAAHALLRLAKERGARVIWVGDRDQLPAIEAGRAFGLLMDRGLAVARIDTIVRQKDPQLRRAVKMTINREHGAAIGTLRSRIVEVRDRNRRLEAVAKSYLQLPSEAQVSTLVVTPSNEDRRHLNTEIRVGLRKAGHLRGPELSAQILITKNLTRAEKTDAAHYEVGDFVRFGRTYKKYGVTKDESLVVKAIDIPSGRITLSNGDGTERTWEPKRAKKIEVYSAEERSLCAGDRIRWTRNDSSLSRYNAELADVLTVDGAQGTARILVGGHIQTLDLRSEKHWEHAYVSTVHAAQGRTADRLILHLDTAQAQLIGHQSWYVGISRAKRHLELFTDDAERLPHAITRPLEQESALEIVREGAAREVARARLPRGFEIGR